MIFVSQSRSQRAEGNEINKVLSGFKEIAGKRAESSRFVARNQISNFNALNNKLRYQNLGITEAIWVTTKKEKVRPSHRDRHGKRFKIEDGLKSSLDGKTLLPGVDYNCECVMKPIIPDDE